jgi:alcohol-forming fatty acyl-CoA reductase
MDILALAVGKKMIYRRAYKKTEQILIMMSFFGLREWNFGNRNVEMLLEKTRNFRYQHANMDFDMRKINWEEYFRNYIPGIKRYYLKENIDKSSRLAEQYQW